MLMFNQLVSYKCPVEGIQKLEQRDVYSRLVKDRGRIGRINIHGNVYKPDDYGCPVILDGEEHYWYKEQL